MRKDHQTQQLQTAADTFVEAVCRYVPEGAGIILSVARARIPDAGEWDGLCIQSSSLALRTEGTILDTMASGAIALGNMLGRFAADEAEHAGVGGFEAMASVLAAILGGRAREGASQPQAAALMLGALGEALLETAGGMLEEQAQPGHIRQEYER